MIILSVFFFCLISTLTKYRTNNVKVETRNRKNAVVTDYPGFGNSMPDRSKFACTFDKLAEIVEGLLKQISFTQFGMYVQDYGGPIGFRIINRHADWLEWLIVQNSNVYEIGFTKAWDGFRNSLWKNRTPETETPLAAFLQMEAIKQVYLYGHKNPELISPDNWNMDFRFMERPSARQVQMDLFYDYRNNVALYPQWQKLLRERHPDTLIFWGQNDIFFTPEGGEAYLRDLPNAEMHRLDSGHFAVEDCLEEISNNIVRFYEGRTAKVLIRE